MKEDLHVLVSSPKRRAAFAYTLSGDFRTYLDVMFYYINEHKFIFKPFHNRIINKLQRIAEGLNEKRNLCINVPVGSGKSIIVEYFITWCFARSIDHTFCYVSNSDSLITRLSKEAKDIVQSDLWLKLWGHRLNKNNQSVYSWSFAGGKNRTGLTAGTMGGSLTGIDAGNPNKEGFPGALIIDDPIDADKVKHLSYREQAVESYDNKLSTRRRSPQTPTILIMQRLHLYDLAGWAKANEMEDWDFLIIPALDDKGVSFWEEKYPVKELEKINKVNPAKMAAQYQQHPIVAGGEVIQTSWFKYYTHYRDKVFDKIIITADTAQKTKEHNDYSVLSAWGVSNDLWLLDIVRDKWEAPELKRQALAFWDKWKMGINDVHCTAFYVEDKSSGTGLIQEIRDSSSIPIIGVERSTDKLTRLEDVLTYLEAGRVWLPVSPEYSFNPAFLSECEGFARDLSHPFDDQIDTLIDAIEKGIANRAISILNVVK